MRIKTARTNRAIDKWREKAQTEATRFYTSTVAVVVFVLSAPKRGKLALILPVVVTAALNFAVFELVFLVVIGFFTAKLYCYKFANSMLKLMPFSRHSAYG